MSSRTILALNRLAPRLVNSCTRQTPQCFAIGNKFINTTTSRAATVKLDNYIDPPPKRKNFKENLLPDNWIRLIEKYPEFLPDPIVRNPFLTMRMIDDMLERRKVIEIPEFYVGSVLAVTCSDNYAETKKSRFLGICVHRAGQLHWSNFTLRNYIDGTGIEIRYDLYNPRILSIEVLRFERRLDNHLLYLRDALPEYSTFPLDMKPEPYDENAEPPLNKLQVEMKPFPWHRRWERHFLKGVQKLENVPEIFMQRAKAIEDDPVYSYDLMLEYRRHCTEEQVYNICKRLAEHEETVVKERKEVRAKRFLRVARRARQIGDTEETYATTETSSQTEEEPDNTKPESTPSITT